MYVGALTNGLVACKHIYYKVANVYQTNNCMF